MTDIKETIQGLYALKTYLASKAIEEHGPARESLIGMQKVVVSVVNLLKEQEAVKPTWSRGKPFCGACGLRIHGGKFCSECGKPISWKEQ